MSVAEALAAVRDRVGSAGGDGVVIVAVTKGFGPEVMAAVLDAGCRDLGESYAQELIPKLVALHAARAASPTGTAPVVHFIGRVQRNKVRTLAAHVHRWDSVDRISVAAEIARRAGPARVLVQVDAAGEPGKGGCPPGEVPELVAQCRDLGLAVEGLMTVGPTQGGPEVARPVFRTVRALADDLGLAVRSMGMSADLEVAVEEGATEVRVGSALLGPRPRRG